VGLEFSKSKFEKTRELSHVSEWMVLISLIVLAPPPQYFGVLAFPWRMLLTIFNLLTFPAANFTDETRVKATSNM
jgi:hypothetical protein